MTESNQQAIEQQIAELQQKLAQEKAANPGNEAVPAEQGEGLAAHAPEPDQNAAPAAMPAPEAPVAQMETAVDQALADQVQHYADIALNDGPDAAIQKAAATGNAAIIDAVHDRLALMHDELVSRGKIQPAQ